MHGFVDYATVLGLLMSPDLVGMQTTALIFTYALAIVHLALTTFTDFEAGIFRVVPLRTHGLIEMVVSFVLIGVAIGFGVSGDHVSFYFYLIFSVVLFIVWVASDYTRYPTSMKHKDFKA